MHDLYGDGSHPDELSRCILIDDEFAIEFDLYVVGDVL